MPVWVQRLIKTKALRTAYHEAGHCIVAAIFDHKLYLKALTLDKAFLASHDKTWNGALLIEWYTQPQPHELEPGDHIILVALAGMCAQTLYSKGKNFVVKNRALFPKNPKLMDIDGGSVDYKIAQMYSVPIASNIQGVHNTHIEWSAIRWIYDYLMEPQVWRATKLVAEELLRSPNKSLDSTEIAVFLKEIGFNNYLTANKARLLGQRYPFTYAKFKV